MVLPSMAYFHIILLKCTKAISQHHILHHKNLYGNWRLQKVAFDDKCYPLSSKTNYVVHCCAFPNTNSVIIEFIFPKLSCCAINDVIYMISEAYNVLCFSPVMCSNTPIALGSMVWRSTKKHL